jgi:hypothetical protein
MAFKVKTKERKALARALQREIKSLGLVDTWAMYDGVRIAAESSSVELNVITLTVVAPYYYLFQDMGTVRDTKEGKRMVLKPQNITEKWTERPAFQKVITEILQQYVDYTMENFPILNVGKILTNPRVQIGFSFYGDETGKWNIDIAPTKF